MARYTPRTTVKYSEYRAQRSAGECMVSLLAGADSESPDMNDRTMTTLSSVLHELEKAEPRSRTAVLESLRRERGATLVDLAQELLGMTAEDALPNRADRFERLLDNGAGAQGSVTIARDKLLCRLVALKSFPEGGVESGYGLAWREAVGMSMVSHPTIPSVYDLIPFAEGYTLVTSAAADSLDPEAPHRGIGLPLPTFSSDTSDKVRHPENLDEILAWMIQIGEGLEACHAVGVFHRDVKPANIVISELGRAFLVDFGVSLAARLDGAEQLDYPGTLDWMAPEVASRTLPPRDDTSLRLADIYSFGATLYTLIAGHPPHWDRTHWVGIPSIATTQAINRTLLEELTRDERSQLDQVRLARAVERPTPLDDISCAFPGDPDLVRIVEQCMTAEPRDRLPSMERVLEELRARRSRVPLRTQSISVQLRYAWHGTSWPLRVFLGVWMLLTLALAIA